MSNRFCANNSARRQSGLLKIPVAQFFLPGSGTAVPFRQVRATFWGIDPQPSTQSSQPAPSWGGRRRSRFSELASLQSLLRLALFMSIQIPFDTPDIPPGPPFQSLQLIMNGECGTNAGI